MPKPTPQTQPQQRALADELRAIRATARVSMQWVADQLGWSQPTVSRIESGRRAVTPHEVVAMLALYRVTGAERDRLVAMAQDADRSNWLETRFPGLPSQATTLGQYESEANRIVYVDLVLVTGLLQTPAYIRAVMNATGVPATQIQPRVDLRQERQKILDKDDPPSVLAILDEAALRRQMGSRRVMAEQLRYLLAAAERPHVELRVIPFDHGGHAAVDGAFIMLEFASAPTYVHFEHTRAGVFLHEPADVRPYIDVVASIEAVALDAKQSAEFVGDVLAGYERE